jgi:hypothetical protein
MLVSRALRLILPPVCLCLSCFAQQTGLTGRITDNSSAIVVDAIVKVVDTATGAATSTLSNQQGIYSFPALIASDYKLRVETPGFSVVERNVTVLVGQVVSVDVQLSPAAVSSSVNVEAQAIDINVTSSQVAGQIDPRQMRDVPLNGRNWLELGLLVPGVTKNAVGQGESPLSGGDSGRYQINLDGQQVTQNTAGTGSQAQYSRDAIAQFQIITTRFDATLGRASRVQINAQTKSGTNQLHGTAYGYFRDSRFNAADKIAKTVLPYENQQYGGTIGGAIRKDKLWFFGAYEGERQPSTIFATPTGFEGLSFTFPSKTTQKSVLMRFDYHLDDANRFSLRLNLSDFDNPFSLAGTAHPSRAISSTRHSKGAMANWSRTLSPSLVSDAKAGFSYHSWTNDPIVPSQEYRMGGITLGAPYNYPGDRFQNTFQFREDLYWLKRSHNIKFGAEYINTRHYGFFQQNARGVVTSFSKVPPNLPAIFKVWNDPSTWDLAALSQYSQSFVQGFGDFNLNIVRHTLAAWFQDDWKIAPRLTLNLGVRYDNDIGMLGDGPKLKSGLKTPDHGDNNNIAPRLGFAWDVTGSRRSVIRGGIGLYYADIQANQYYNQQLFNGERTIQAAVDAKPGAPINLAQPFAYTGADFVSGKAPAPLQSLQLIDPNVVTPMSYQASIGIEKTIGRNWEVSADYVNWRTYHEWYRIDSNLAFDPATGFNKNPNLTARPDQRFTSILLFTTPRPSGALYNALQAEVRRRFANGLTLAFAYTLSHMRDSSEGSFTPGNNQFDLGGEWGNATDDQRHTFNLNGGYQLKWGFLLSGVYRYGSGAAFATTAGGNPFANGGTNRTFLATTRTYNDPKDNSPAPFAPGYLIAKRNAFYGRPIHRTDLRLTKTFPVKERFRVIGIVEAFNLFNRSNFGSYSTVVTSASYGQPAQNGNLAYAARMLQFSGRFEF